MQKYYGNKGVYTQYGFRPVPRTAQHYKIDWTPVIITAVVLVIVGITIIGGI